MGAARWATWASRRSRRCTWCSACAAAPRETSLIALREGACRGTVCAPRTRPGFARGSLRVERVLAVGLRHEAVDGVHHLRNRPGRRPRVLEHLKADTPRRVDVRVEDLSLELHVGRLE